VGLDEKLNLRGERGMSDSRYLLSSGTSFNADIVRQPQLEMPQRKFHSSEYSSSEKLYEFHDVGG